MAAEHHRLPVSRRRFVQGAAVAGLGLLAGCGRPPAQVSPPSRVWRVGLLTPVATPWFYKADFLGGLQEWSYVGGQNLHIEYRYADNDRDRLGTLAAELVQSHLDLLVTHTTPGTAAAHRATTELPIVFMAISDPVGQGFVASLARPGGNLTGTSDFGVTLSGKRLELLREIVGTDAPLAVLRDADSPANDLEWTVTQEAARTLGAALYPLDIRGAEDLPGAFDMAKAAHCGGLLVLTSPIINQNLPRIVERAEADRLPVMYFQRAQAAGGGLMAYGPSYPDLYRRTGYFVDRVLKGAPPAELPVEQPTKFDFVINLKTAQALGLTIPPHVLLQATEVIQ
jgi:putative tryptophan/tyrosine transport system substrate-binding protein